MKIKASRALAGAAVTLAAVGTSFMFRGGKEVQASQELKADLPFVELFTAVAKEKRQWNHYSGRLSAVNSAQIRPRVSGRISEVRFREGQSVAQGEVLFVIDPQPYEAAVDAAKASLLAAKTQNQLAQLELSRSTVLVKEKAVSREVFDTKASAAKLTQAAIGLAEARLRQAEIDLDYAYVKSPINGRISRAELTLGNNVEPGAGAPLLATVVDLDRLYAEFQIDEATYATILGETKGDESIEQRMPVRVSAGTEVHAVNGKSYVARLMPFDNQLNVESGSIRARALVENTSRTLIPGLFVTVGLGSISSRPTVELPERAIGVDQSKRFVYLVDSSQTVQRREVKLGASATGFRQILDGIKIGERIVTSSIDKIRPGIKVQGTQSILTVPEASPDFF